MEQLSGLGRLLVPAGMVPTQDVCRFLVIEIEMAPQCEAFVTSMVGECGEQFPERVGEAVGLFFGDKVRGYQVTPKLDDGGVVRELPLEAVGSAPNGRAHLTWTKGFLHWAEAGPKYADPQLYEHQLFVTEAEARGLLAILREAIKTVGQPSIVGIPYSEAAAADAVAHVHRTKGPGLSIQACAEAVLIDHPHWGTGGNRRRVRVAAQKWQIGQAGGVRRGRPPKQRAE